MPANARAHLNVLLCSVIQLLTLACHLVQSPSQQAHIPLDAIALATLSVLLAIVMLAIPTFVFQTAQEPQASLIPVSVPAQVSAYPDSVTQLLTPACRHAQFLNLLAHIHSVAIAPVAQSALPVIVMWVTLTLAYLTVLVHQDLQIHVNALAHLNATPYSVIQLQTLVCHLVQFPNRLAHTPLVVSVNRTLIA